MRKIKRCPAKIGNPVKWRHLLRHWFTLYDKIKTVITFLLFDRFWQMTQICEIIFCGFFKKKIFTFFGYHLSDVITIGNDLEHLRHQWCHSSCPMGEMITNHFFFEKYSPMPWFWYIDCPDRSRNKKVMVFWKWRK